MAMDVIKSLEMIDIRHDDTDRIWFARSPDHFECKHFFQVTPVEQPGQRIANGQLAQPRFTLDEQLCLPIDLLKVALSQHGRHHHQPADCQDKEKCINVIRGGNARRNCWKQQQTQESGQEDNRCRTRREKQAADQPAEHQKKKKLRIL